MRKPKPARHYDVKLPCLPEHMTKEAVFEVYRQIPEGQGRLRETGRQCFGAGLNERLYRMLCKWQKADQWVVRARLWNSCDQAIDIDQEQREKARRLMSSVVLKLVNDFAGKVKRGEYEIKTGQDAERFMRLYFYLEGEPESRVEMTTRIPDERRKTDEELEEEMRVMARKVAGLVEMELKADGGAKPKVGA